MFSPTTVWTAEDRLQVMLLVARKMREEADASLLVSSHKVIDWSMTLEMLCTGHSQMLEMNRSGILQGLT